MRTRYPLPAPGASQRAAALRSEGEARRRMRVTMQEAIAAGRADWYAEQFPMERAVLLDNLEAGAYDAAADPTQRLEAVRQLLAVEGEPAVARLALLRDPLLGPLVAPLARFPHGNEAARRLIALGLAVSWAGDLPLMLPLDLLLRSGPVRSVWRDLGTGETHASALRTLAGLLVPFDAVVFDERGVSAQRTLIATYAGRVRTGSAHTAGRELDLAAVLTLLNCIATDMGLPDRFVELQTWGDRAHVLVADGSALAEALACGLVPAADCAPGDGGA